MKKNVSKPCSAALLLLTIILFSVIGFGSCNKQASARVRQRAKGELRYGFPTEPLSLDPLNPSNTADSRSILFNVFEGLVKPDTSGRLRPCAAESWSIEEDGLIYEFHLRNNVLFHDGSHLNSEDVRFSLETAIAENFPGFADIDKIEILSDMDFRINLKSPDPEFLPFLTIGIVKAGNTDREKYFCGTGPFSIESYEKQHSIVLKRFPGYWRQIRESSSDENNAQQPVQGLIPLEKVTIQFMTDSNAIIPALKAGSIDGGSLTGAQVRQLNYTMFDIIPYYSASVHMMALNNAVEPFNDHRVRKAINS